MSVSLDTFLYLDQNKLPTAPSEIRLSLKYLNYHNLAKTHVVSSSVLSADVSFVPVIKD